MSAEGRGRDSCLVVIDHAGNVEVSVDARKPILCQVLEPLVVGNNFRLGREVVPQDSGEGRDLVLADVSLMEQLPVEVGLFNHVPIYEL